LNRPSTGAVSQTDTPFDPDAGTVPTEVDPEEVRRAYRGAMMPGEMTALFRRTEALFPSRIVSRGKGPATPIPKSAKGLPDLAIASGGKTYDLYDYVSRNRTTGLLVLKDGISKFEHYEAGNTPQTRWISMSMAKSVTTTLIGAAIRDGLIDHVDQLLTDYLPELAGTAYGDVTIRHLMQMSSGVQWNEEHTDLTSHRTDVLNLQIGQQPGTILKYMAALPKMAPSGTLWNYSTGETYVAGELLHRAIGRPLSHYLSEKIWSRVGMESDASWWLESPDGLEVAGSGIGATLRDYARFGAFIADDGCIGTERVLPEGWVREAGAPRTIGDQEVAYGYMWWCVPSPTRGYEDGAFAARGIFGQFLYVNPKRKIVIAVTSARSKPRFAEVVLDNDFFNAVVDAIG